MTSHITHVTIVLVALFCCSTIRAAPVEEQGLEFLILHNNDMHARFEETDKSSNKCSEKDAAAKKCYGGFPRTAHLINKYRKEAMEPEGVPVLYLNAGDTYSGTNWYTIFKHAIVSEMMNILAPDAMCLGNHEFDSGVKGLVPFLEAVKFPVVSANLGLDKHPELKAVKSLKGSTILEVKGVKIGVVGYLTPDTKNMASVDNVEIYPEIEYVKKEVEKLKSDGIEIIIALGHSGFEKDKEIAAAVPELDLVIGGHTNTFLYNGAAPDIEQPVGPYPFVVTQTSGKMVPVIQAYAYTKYLGKLQVKFNPKGDLISWEGNPILLDNSIPQDPDVLKALDVYRPNISAVGDEVIGYTKVYLNGTKPACRKSECILGDLIADSFIYAREKELKTTDTYVSFVQAGAIRSSIERKPDGGVTNNDVLGVMPFNNTLYVVEVPGEKIKAALELSADNYNRDHMNGGFLQMSGVKVKYDMSKPSGERAVEIKLKCAECDDKGYVDLDVAKKYKIMLSAFLLKGGDGHKWSDGADPFEGAIKMDISDYQATLDYIREKGPIDYKLESRIVIN